MPSINRMEEESMSTAAIYCRLSQDDEEEGESRSITNQRELLLDYCRTHNITDYKIYIDDGISGMDFSRPQFQQMLRDCEAGVVDTVICKDQSRFSRDDTVIKKYLHEQFYIWGIHYIGVTDGTDNTSADFLDNSAFRGFFNEYYIRDCSRKVKAVLQAKKQRGEWATCAPYGYKKDTEKVNHLVPDNNVADIVRRIFADYVNGKSLTQMAKELNAEGVTSPAMYKQKIYPNYKSPHTHGKWTADGIKAILHNEVYTGTTVYGKTVKQSYRSKEIKVPQAEWKRIPNTHEPLISQDLWEQANSRTADKSTRASRKTGQIYPLSGVVKCACCGHTMYREGVTAKGKQYIYYRCKQATNGSGLCSNKQAINCNSLTEVVLTEINNAIKQYLNKDSITAKPNAEKYQKHLSTIHTQQSTINTRISNLIDLVADGTITREQFKQSQDKYNQQLQDLQEQEQQVQAQIDKLNDTAYIDNLVKQYTTGNITELSKQLVTDLIQDIKVGKLNNGTFIEVNTKF